MKGPGGLGEDSMKGYRRTPSVQTNAAGTARASACFGPVLAREGATIRSRRSRMAAKTLAAIDVGSNSIKLLVARRDPSDGGHWSEILREKEMVRLGRETVSYSHLRAHETR